LVWVTAVTLLLLLNDVYKFESLQENGRTRQAIPQTAGCKARAVLLLCVNKLESLIIFILSSRLF